jgi:Na+-exporting ATPase
MSNEKQTQVSEHVSGQANKPLSQPPHALCSIDFVAEIQAVPGDGLTDIEAQSRLGTYGTNELDDGPGVQPVKILIRQIANAMILVK